ncbi:hypothetical protein [Curtobacterium sp. MEB011]|uniref:hypothetical protein n=1 Tax=Curtobacterium sp. MEB011 TaxID=3040285 RepID=UPI00254CFD00|nr:hypothetical protein [Curtobacterium sp. MEB011]
MTALTPQQMRDRADENAEWAQTAFGLPGREQDARELLLNADMFRTAADQLDAVQRPANLTIAELDTQPGGTVVVGPDGLIWERSEVGCSVDGRLAWFPLVHEVGSSSHEVGHGARVILTADTAPQEEPDE